MPYNPYDIVSEFEKTVGLYTDAPFAIAVDSATSAVFLCCQYLNIEGQVVECPAHTYPSIPMSIIHAGGKVKFVDYKWQGAYQLKPFPIWDAAKRFTSGMFNQILLSNNLPYHYVCLSFHFKKRLGLGKGGMILTNDDYADKWFRRARYEGREGKPLHQENITMLGWNMYMRPSDAANGLLLMTNMPKDNPDQIEEPDYPDCRSWVCFQSHPNVVK